MSYGTSGTSAPWHQPGNRGLDRLRALRAGAAPPPVGEVANCTACGAELFLEQDLLCPACYQSRRAPGRVLAFDPGRRSRTLARLADRSCPDCQTATWHVNGAGDATCQTCAQARAATTPTPTDSVPAGGRR